MLIQLLFVGKELDRLHLQIDSLKNENISLLDDVKRFEEERAKARKSQNLVVEHLEVHIMDPKPDQFTETELIRLVKEDTKYLIGKKLETINDLHLSVRQQFKGRTYEVKDALVQTELRAMTIYTTVHLHIYAKPLPQTP
ncbi:hypothetical protein BEP19_04920 [Ammoniphilus oxalaticus]|uniref:Sporulation membrane protein YtrI C-terminal domain-containing protein n=1 Tax=Ammoniphilus oxalaticus TaxID=66863 RepID=A0A419SIA9_9BACL|nr:hypothetical protein [Ammoniphilus oxalaticus]RKD23774.1 hypothetical protein BEP19_04920 [Ammoniphilus oxalaticus]